MKNKCFFGKVTVLFVSLHICVYMFSGCEHISENIPGVSSEQQDTYVAVSTAYSEENWTSAEAEGGDIEGTTGNLSLQTDDTPEITAAVTECETSVPDVTYLSVGSTIQAKAYEDESAAETAESVSEAPSITVLTIPASRENLSAVQTAESLTVQPAESETEQSVSENNTASYQESAYYPINLYYTLNFSAQKAVWVSFLEYDRIMSGHTEEEFTSALGECFDNIAAIGCNTVYFQVRAHGDAYYDSQLYPASSRLAGVIGGDIPYDPLLIAVKAAHDRGLSIHAWVNPMRLMTDSELQSLSNDILLKQWYNDSSKRGRYIVQYDGRWYLNPAYSETTALICNGIREIVTGYDIDGIQIDDYFYPTTDSSFDSDAYKSSGTELSLGDWRRSLITSMVKNIYKTVHSSNPTAVFGISPQGNVENNYSQLYADTESWCKEAGCCDYICPQIYYGFENTALPFEETVAQWQSFTYQSGVCLIIGLAAYKSGIEDNYAGSGKNEWINNTDVLARQTVCAEKYGAGYALFRYDSLFEPDDAVQASVSAELANLRSE